MSRQEANRKIVEELSKAVEKYPDLRFHQLLYNMDVQVPIPILDKDGLQAGMHFKDLHHEESIDTLDRMAKDY
jgi:hypothetical protein